VVAGSFRRIASTIWIETKPGRWEMEKLKPTVSGDVTVELENYRALKDLRVARDPVDALPLVPTGRVGRFELAMAKSMIRSRRETEDRAGSWAAAREVATPVFTPKAMMTRAFGLDLASFQPVPVEDTTGGRPGFTLPGLGGTTPGCGEEFRMLHPVTGHCRYDGRVVRLDHHCGLRACCASVWVRELAARTAAHFESIRRALKWHAKHVRHVIVSPPQEIQVAWSKDARELRRQAHALLVRHGAPHGKVVFHAWRCEERDRRADPSEWRWGPHFHGVVLAGSMDLGGICDRCERDD